MCSRYLQRWWRTPSPGPKERFWAVEPMERSVPLDPPYRNINAEPTPNTLISSDIRVHCFIRVLLKSWSATSTPFPQRNRVKAFGLIYLNSPQKEIFFLKRNRVDVAFIRDG